MREKQKRRRFSREFKLEAVRQLEAGQRLAEVARQLEVNRTVLQRWRAQFADDPETGSRGMADDARRKMKWSACSKRMPSCGRNSTL